MTRRPDLSKLSSDEKDALIVRIEVLEARQGEPLKDPGNSSIPPSAGRKRNKLHRPRGLRREASEGQEGAADESCTRTRIGSSQEGEALPALRDGCCSGRAVSASSLRQDRASGDPPRM
jgi:hypothetical protein